ncbi:Holliday junction branch migration DNA helicase RuvB [Candidatus Parcubacteria bacterium]|nr:Holliday junction branch migration DNA helicase RuvB [Candidatus Parcubacteria bacterium]
MVPQNAKKSSPDPVLDATLRPRNWQEFIGQKKLKANLWVAIEAAKSRGEPLDHLLFYGPPGLGKTSLAHLIAAEMGAALTPTTGPAIERTGDLAAILTNLAEKSVLFIDEIHRLAKPVEELLYPALEARSLHIILGRGPGARTLELQLPTFTLIAATTRPAMLSAPLRSRFGTTWRLDFYEAPEIEQILERSSRLLNITLAAEARRLIAVSSRATPRTANRLLKRVRDLAQTRGETVVSPDTAREALRMLEVDAEGLEPTDRRLLTALIEQFRGGPVGLKTLAAATAEDEGTIEDVYEPYLLQLGFIERTPRGRTATAKAYAHLGKGAVARLL